MRLHLRLLAALLVATLLYSCGHTRSLLTGGLASRDSASPLLLSVEAASGKSVSGLPTGVMVTWTRATDPLAIGYYLYRDTQPITTANPALRVNGGSTISQPPSGASVIFYDEFYPAIGQTYYYRLSVVDVYDEESDLSNQLSIIISTHSVTGFDPESGYYGDQVTLAGANFGIYDLATDHVTFTTDSLQAVEAAVDEWAQDYIVCTVPGDAITGPICVVISSTVAQTDEDFTVLNPYLKNVLPGHAYFDEEVTVRGENFPATPGPGDGLVFPGGYLVEFDSELIVSYTIVDGDFDEIVVRVPPAIDSSGEIHAVFSAEDTNGVPFSVDPDIGEAVPRFLVPGSSAKVSVTGMNLGDGSDGTLFVVDTSEVDPLPAVAIPLDFIVSWDNYEIVFTTPIGEYNRDASALRVRRGTLWSQSFAVGILDPLQIEFLYPAPNSTLTEPTVVAIRADGVQQASRVEFYLGGSSQPVYTDAFGPDFSYTLDPAEFRNGTYYLTAKAYRFQEAALGMLVFDVLSLRGDTNGDGFVDDLDIQKIRQRFGDKLGDASYHQYLDPNLDGVINEADVSYIGYNFTGSPGGS
jgi:hypothetical protein